MARYLLAASALPGHVDPIVGIARGLVAQGHGVMVHTGQLFAAQVERAGAQFAPIDPAIDVDYRALDTLFPERAALPPGPAQMLWGVRHLFADAMTSQHASLQRLIETFKPDIMLTDMMFMGTLPLLLMPRANRPPIMHLGHSVFTLASPETGFFGMALPVARTQAQRLRNRAVIAAMENQLFAPLQNYINATLDRMGMPALPCFAAEAVIRLPDRYLQIGVPSMEYARSNLPPNLRFIGALPPTGTVASQPDWWDEIRVARQAGRRIVLVTQGTIANVDPMQLCGPTINALAGPDALVIAITSSDPAAFQPHIPAATLQAAVIKSFIPYAQIMPELDLFITNGGFGGVTLALRYGVPMIIAGDSEEKPEIGARIAHIGAGIDLATAYPTASMIGAAAAMIAEQPSFKRVARSIADDLAAIDTIGEIEAARLELTQQTGSVPRAA